MERWRGKVAVVTGASSGIGLAIAKALVREGMLVVGLARRKEKMENDMRNATGPGKFYARECDVSDEKSVKEAFDYIGDTLSAVHLLVNNAGIVTIKSIEDAPVEELQQIVNVNVMGVLYCYKNAIPLMKASNDEAHIVNINSITGHKVPTASWMRGKYIPLNVYPATKFALTALSEIFANELRDCNIRVTNLSPGYVATSIAEGSVGEKKHGASSLPALQPEDIAESVVFVVGAPKHVQITQLTIKPLGETF